MTVNTNISLSSLDPDTLKQNFIQWMMTQSVFQDYNFAGSNLNVLDDLLARNTFLNSFLVNMAFSETHNDSAQLRDSLVSKSKELGYLPYSVTSSTTSINLAIQTANLTNFEIPKGTIFTGLNSNGTFSFVTDQNDFATSSNGFFSFSNVNIFDGFYVSEVFSVDTNIENQLFTLSNPGIDISSLTIIVSENSGSQNTIFTPAPNLYGLNGNSNVYFIQASSGNTYQIYFGDGVTGYIPQNGGIVVANYRVASGEPANFINSFMMVTNLAALNGGSISSISITSNDVTTGGAAAESIESIRFNNPIHYQTQDNAVTGFDYKTLILENFPSLKDVNIFSGGITPNAVQYGVIFVCPITKQGNFTTQTTKNDIISFLQPLSVLNPPIQVIDPDFLYIQVNSNVHVDFTQTLLLPNQYKTEVINTISTFSNTNLGKFNTPFRFSNLTDNIDNIDTSIISNETSITLKKFANVILNVNTSIILNYSNPVVNVISDQFIIGSNTYYISDAVKTPLFDLDARTGGLYLVEVSPNNAITYANTIGTIDYSVGYLNISPLNITQFSQNSIGIGFYAFPANKDQYPNGDDIIKIDPLGINVNIVSG